MEVIQKSLMTPSPTTSLQSDQSINMEPSMVEPLRWGRLRIGAIVLLLVFVSICFTPFLNPILTMIGSSDREHSTKTNLYFRLIVPDKDQDKNGNISSTATTDPAATLFQFKILQLADIHFSEAEGTDWGPEQDHKSWIAMDKMIRRESSSDGSIDLLVLSGDQITGNNCLYNCTTYYRQLADFLTPYNIPWAVTFGNHDDMDYEIKFSNGTIVVVPAKVTRQDLLRVMQEYPLDHSQEGPSALFGTTNYVLDIHLPAMFSTVTSSGIVTEGGADESSRIIQSSQVAAQIYLLDSGGGQLPQEIQQNQIDWFVEQQQTSTVPLPAVAFQHIPTIEFDYHNDKDGNSDQEPKGDNPYPSAASTASTRCQGFQGEGLSPLQDGDAGIVQALSDSGRVQVLGVGHDHGNDYCCNFSDYLHLCFGRHSGYGGYSHHDWERGARVYELTLIRPSSPPHAAAGNSDMKDANYNQDDDDPISYSMTWKSWVRLESGEVTSRIP